MGRKPSGSAPLWPLGLLAAVGFLLLVSPALTLPEWAFVSLLVVVGLAAVFLRYLWTEARPPRPEEKQALLRQNVIRGLRPKQD